MSLSRYSMQITAEPEFLADESEPDKGRYVFAYTITIENTGQVPAQLISRHWVITDSMNHVQEVRGLGVIGQQPWLRPGESFRYTSGCTLETAMGTMRGSYSMVTADHTTFEAPIPEFVLAPPNRLH
jgi:ApaG protein